MNGGFSSIFHSYVKFPKAITSPYSQVEMFHMVPSQADIDNKNRRLLETTLPTPGSYQ